MPQVTRVVAGKRNPGRVNIYIDGTFGFAISLEMVVRDGIRRGADLSEEVIASYKASDAKEKLYGKVLNFLSYRPHSVREVRDRIHHYAPDTTKEEIDTLVGRLTRDGYLSDDEFAKWFAGSRASNRPRSRRALFAELVRKGVEKEVIESVLPERDLEAIRAAISRRKNLPKEKLMRYLARQGFSYDDIKAALLEE